MNRLVAVAILLGPIASAWAWDPPSSRPHPAVVRVIAPEDGGASLGSGTLVGTNETLGLVVTNWHVVRDATGPIRVVFPDGFSSEATVLKTDRDWDLAALIIWRPSVQPVSLASQAPRPGERLVIAGYGRGSFRAAAGQCTQYVSPGGNLPFEMVEIDTAARSGDSGGPILNQRGELAGVLFGAGFGRTAGSYCGRVRSFLELALNEFHRAPAPSTLVAQRTPTPPPYWARPASPPPVASPSASPTPSALPAQAASASHNHAPPVAAIVGVRPSPAELARSSQGLVAAQPEIAELPIPRPALVQPPNPSVGAQSANMPEPGPTRGDQIKTVLAAIGLLAVLFHGLRLVGAAQQA